MNDLEHYRIRRAMKKNTRVEIALLILAILALGIFFLVTGCDHVDVMRDRTINTNQSNIQ